MNEQDFRLAKKHAIYVTEEDRYTEVLPDDFIFCPEAFETFLAERDALKAQRDELLEALDGALQSIKSGVTSLGVIRAAETLISKHRPAAQEEGAAS